MAFCSNCGERVPSNEARFCSVCGTAKAEKIETIRSAGNKASDEDFSIIVNDAAKLFAAGKIEEGIKATLPAAEAGVPMALNNIGFAYYSLGENKKASKYLTKAAEAGVPQAMQTLVAMLWTDEEPRKKDQKEIEKWLNRLAELDDVDAMYDLFCLYDFFGNEKLAKKWVKAAAEAGHSDAQEAWNEMGLEESWEENADGTFSLTISRLEEGGLGKMPK